MMQSGKIDNKGVARLFQNNFLESLSKTRPWVIYTIYIPLCSYMLYYSYAYFKYSLQLVTVIFFTAMFSWTLFEYLTHRYLFHFKPSGKIGKNLVYIFHGNHHEYPRDKKRLFMPPLPSLIFSSTVFGLIYGCSFLITGTGNLAFVYFPGFIFGYLIYVSIHYAIHSYSPPKYLKRLWRHHHLHHYKDSEGGFGVSTLLWDYLFGTLPKK